MNESEASIQRAVMEWLSWKRIFFYRQNTGAVVYEHKGKQRFMRYGVSGGSDIVAVIGGKYIAIEVKAKSKQSPAQQEFQAQLEAAGGTYLLVHSVDELERMINQN